VRLDKWQELGFEKKMVGTANNGRMRHAFSVVNGEEEVGLNSVPPSNAGSEYGGFEFTREDVYGLLNERMRYKNKFNYKVSESFCFYFFFC
jgi:kinesin family protein C1